MIIKANSFSGLRCWSLSKSLSWSNPRYLCISWSRVRYGSLDRYWSDSWSGFSVWSACWSTDI